MFENAKGEATQIKGANQLVAERPESLAPHLIMAAEPIEVKSKIKPAQSAPEAAQAQSDKSEKPKDVMQALVDLPKDQIGKGVQQSQEAVKEFLQAKQKGSPSDALTQTAPKFEAAIEQSDKDFGNVMGDKWSAVVSARRDLAMLQSQEMLAQQKAKQVIGTLDPAQRNAAMAMTGLMMDGSVSQETKNHLREAMKNYPGLLPNVDNMMAIEKKGEAATKVLQAAQEPLLKAAQEQAATRYIYAKAMEQTGDTGKAVILKQQAQELYNASASRIRGSAAAEVKPAIEA